MALCNSYLFSVYLNVSKLCYFCYIFIVWEGRHLYSTTPLKLVNGFQWNFQGNLSNSRHCVLIFKSLFIQMLFLGIPISVGGHYYSVIWEGLHPLHNFSKWISMKLAEVFLVTNAIVHLLFYYFVFFQIWYLGHPI